MHVVGGINLLHRSEAGRFEWHATLVASASALLDEAHRPNSTGTAM